MKVLVTGCTASQVGSQRRAMMLYSFAEALRDGLTVAGHDVDLKPVTVRDDPREYNFCLVGLAPVNALPARHSVGAYVFLKRCVDMGVRCAAFVEDRPVFLIPSSLRTMRHSERIRARMAGPLSNRVDAEWALKYPVLLGKVWRWFLEPWCFPTVAPMFEWGDRGELNARLPMARALITLDWSGMYLDRSKGPVDPGREDRDRSWVMMTLAKKNFQWVEKHIRHSLEWPVRSYGHLHTGLPRVQEREVEEVYTRHWGVLVPPYYLTGSGWCHKRFAQSARSGCVLLCDPREAPAGPYRLWDKRARVEGMTDAGLRTLATAQREWFRANSWGADRFVESCGRMVERHA